MANKTLAINERKNVEIGYQWGFIKFWEPRKSHVSGGFRHSWEKPGVDLCFLPGWPWVCVGAEGQGWRRPAHAHSPEGTHHTRAKHRSKELKLLGTLGSHQLMPTKVTRQRWETSRDKTQTWPKEISKAINQTKSSSDNNTHVQCCHIRLSKCPFSSNNYQPHTRARMVAHSQKKRKEKVNGNCSWPSPAAEFVKDIKSAYLNTFNNLKTQLPKGRGGKEH